MPVAPTASSSAVVEPKAKPGVALQGAFGKKSASTVGKKLTKATSDVAPKPVANRRRSVGGRDDSNTTETLRGFAAHHGVTIDAVRDSNPALRSLLPDDAIPAGTKVIIPSSAPTANKRKGSRSGGGGYVDEHDASDSLLNPVSSKEAQWQAHCEILSDSEFAYRSRIREEWQVVASAQLKDCLAFNAIVRTMLAAWVQLKSAEANQRESIRQDEEEAWPSLMDDFAEGVATVLETVFNECRTAESVQRRGIIEAQYAAWDALQKACPEAFAMAEQASLMGIEYRERRRILPEEWRQRLRITTSRGVVGDEIVARSALRAPEDPAFKALVAQEAEERLATLRLETVRSLIESSTADAHLERAADMEALLAEQVVERADFEAVHLRRRLDDVEAPWLDLAHGIQFQCFVIDAEERHRQCDVEALEDAVRRALKELEVVEEAAAQELTKIRNLERYMALLAAIEGFAEAESAARFERVIEHERRAYKLLCGVEYRDRVLAQAATNTRLAAEEEAQSRRRTMKAADRARLMEELAARVEQQRQAEYDAMLTRHEAQRERLERHEAQGRRAVVQDAYEPACRDLEREYTARLQYARTAEATRIFTQRRTVLEGAEVVQREVLSKDWETASNRFFSDLNRLYAAARYHDRWGHVLDADDDADVLVSVATDAAAMERAETIGRRKLAAGASTGFRAIMDALEVEERMLDPSGWRPSTTLQRDEAEGRRVQLETEAAEWRALAADSFMPPPEHYKRSPMRKPLSARTPRPPITPSPSRASRIQADSSTRPRDGVPRPPPTPPPHCVAMPTCTGAMIRQRFVTEAPLYDGGDAEAGSNAHLYSFQTRFDDIVRTARSSSGVSSPLPEPMAPTELPPTRPRPQSSSSSAVASRGHR